MELVRVQEAYVELELSRAGLYRLLHAHNLSTYRRPGDRASYVDIEALRKVRQEFQPRPPRAKKPPS